MKIYINNGNEKIPENESCYIIAKGGIYLKKKLDLIESLTPVDQISFLDDISTFAKINVPKIPTKLFANILGFFKKVYEMYRSEAIVLLYYNKQKKTYKISVPAQEVTSASITYEPGTGFKNHILIGSIHSHGDMSAFHSGTDVNDEAKFDGIHMTFGKLSTPNNLFDLCCSIAINGMRIPTDPKNYVTGLDSIEYTPYFPQMFRPGFEEINGEKIYKNFVKTSFSFGLENVNEQDYKFDITWLNNVKEKAYEYAHYSGGHQKYAFINGKLISLDNKPDNKKLDNAMFDFSYLNNLHKTKSEGCVCETCIHKDEKLKLKSNNKNKTKLKDDVKDVNDDIFDFYRFDPNDFYGE